MKLYLILFFVAVLSASLVDAKKMWGSRKKREEVVEEPVVAPPKSVYKPSSSRRSAASRRRFNIEDMEDNVDSVDPAAMFTKYLNNFEEILDSADLASIIDVNMVRQVVEQVPGASESPEVAAMLTLIENSDPDTLRVLMKEGIQAVKSSTDEIIAILTNPQKMAELVSQLPPEIREVVQSMQRGDVSALKDFISNLSELDHSQKSLILSLLDGNSDVLAGELKKLLALDDTQIEAARQQLLEHPEMAEALGVDAKVLNDPKKWARMMAKEADKLISQLDGVVGGETTDSGDIDLDALKVKFNSRRSVLDGDSDEDQVEDFLKRFKSKLGRAA